jgi:dTDP-4-dehydrorhamnose reductase
VPGFRNHLWNGITTLEWCKVVEKILADRKTWEEKGLAIQPTLKESLSKADLLRKINRNFDRCIQVEDQDAQLAVNKCLASDFEVAPIDSQLKDLANYKLHYGS